MSLKKTGIVEYIVVFVGIVALLAYIRVAEDAYQPADVAQPSPAMIGAGWSTRSGAAHPAAHLRDVASADAHISREFPGRLEVSARK